MCLPAPALAQNSAPDPAATALFRAGRDLIKAGKWEEGCDKLAASMKRYAAPSTLLNLALCREHEGRFATAWAMAKRAMVLNRDTVGKRRRARLAQAGEEVIARLEPRRAHLRVTVHPSVDGAKVEEDGRELPLDTAVPLDPGKHVLVISAPGRPDEKRDVALQEGETLAVEISLPPLPPPPDPAAPVQPPPPPPPPEEPPAADDTDASVPVWAWVTGGFGLVLGGLAIGFAVDAVNTAAFLEERCGSDLFCQEDLSFDPEPSNERKNRSTALAIGFGAGGVVALTASLIGVLLSIDDDPPGAARVTPWLGPAALGCAVHLSF
jgi:hypothetical protein